MRNIRKENKSLTRNAIFNIAYKLLNVLFPLVTNMYVARILLPAGVGVISAAQNNVSYFVILATLGIPAYGIREIAKVRDREADLNTLFSELVITNAILTSFSLILLFVSMSLIPIFQNEKTLYVIFGFSVFLNFINVDWLYQGLEEYKYIAIRSSIIKVISLISVIIFVRTENDLYKYALIIVLGTSGNYLFNIIHSRRFVRISLKNINLNRHLKPLAFLALCTISTELYARMDITMLNIMQSDAQVGLYTYAHRVINIVITFTVAITAVFLPRLSYYFENDKSKFDELVVFGTNLMVLISIPISVAVVFIAYPTINILFGSEFSGAAPILVILSPMIPLKCIGDIICYQVMMSARQEAVLMKSYFIIMLVNFVNNLLLIPRLGANGAAIASVISEILAIVFVFHYSKRIVSVRIDRRNVISTIITSAIIGYVIYAVNTFEILDFLKVVFSGISFIVLFSSINYLLRNPFYLDFSKLVMRKTKNR